jgi:Pyruvate/2-oxoacid:ferredoxin oxidoreductase delta subunit
VKEKRKIIQIDEEKCSGCGECVSACAEGAIELVQGKARLVSENYCDGLAACLGECPEGALTIVEREADAFDPEAVEDYLKAKKGGGPAPVVETMPCGCPSTQIRIFPTLCTSGEQPASREQVSSELRHWPVQIKLVPPTAPFLKGSDLLVASDCTPVAYPSFHSDFLKGKTVMMGCPKFDDVQEYVDKFTAIFRAAGIKSVTVLIMEVPCCSKMPAIVRAAMEAAGKEIPTEVVVIGASGKVLRRQPLAA